jgi:hypothetical protein
MYKIGISGKAGSGKNTLSKLLVKQLRQESSMSVKYIAFADPIKQIARTMFPDLPERCLTGPSKYRSEIISGAFKGGAPLTVRQLLIDIGTNGRNYDNNIWLNDFTHSLNKAHHKDKKIFIVTDVRFRNEFDLLNKTNFYKIRLFRDSTVKIDDPSETNQDGINDDEFDYVLNNSGTLKQLKLEVTKIVALLKDS